MSKKMIIFFLFFIVTSWSYAGGPRKNVIPGPKFQRPAPSGRTTFKRPSKRFQRFKSVRMRKSNNFSRQLSLKKHRQTKGTSYIYPPYQDAWSQQWSQGTGQVANSSVQKNGYAFHSSNSYAWGMSSTRCWVASYFTAGRSGWYSVKLESYQEGTLRTSLVYSGEVYAYRSIGICVEQDCQYKTVQALHFNRPVGEQKRNFRGWCSISKQVYLQAGRTYWVSGYSEIGGWSTGDENTWQTKNAVCGLGPISLQYIRP